MKTIVNYLHKLTCVIPFAVLLFSLSMNAQDDKSISVYQYRYVAPADMNEYLERETKYWSKVAEHAMTKGNLTFWGIFQKVGGFDMPNTPNIMIINTFNDLDDRKGIWNVKEVFPDVPFEKIETRSLSTTLHHLFVKPQVFVQGKDAVPEKDFNYVHMVYHNASNPRKLIQLEAEHWKPFIKGLMDSGKTTQKAFGNALILSPRGPMMNANTISFDIFSSLHETLNPSFSEDVVFPTEGLKEIFDLETDQRIAYVYKVIKVVEPKKE